jgi:hypothetical protein
MMTTRALTIKNEILELMQVQIETFGRRSGLTSLELREFHHRSERLKLLCRELDRIRKTAILENRFTKAA